MTGSPNGNLTDTRVGRAAAAYEGAARIYDKVIEPPLRALRRAVTAAAAAGPDMRVLDMCCGTGVLALHLANTGASVFGTDLSPHMLDKARHRSGPNLRFVLASSDRLPFPDHAFDLVCMGLALHELPEELRLGFVSEMRRVARPAGRILILDYCVPARNNAVALLYRNAYYLAERMAGGSHYRCYCEWMTGGGLHGFAQRAGLKDSIQAFYGGAMGLLRFAGDR